MGCTIKSIKSTIILGVTSGAANIIMNILTRERIAVLLSITGHHHLQEILSKIK